MTELVQFTLRATLASALHIAGPGRTVALVDRPILLDVEGYPVIPASTVRGRLRAHLERLLRATGEPVCTPPTPDRMCPHHPWDGSGPAGGYCMACCIFGSAWRASRLTGTDLTLVEEQRVAADLLRSERMSVSISRRLGTAQAERLFATEAAIARLGDQPLAFEGSLTGHLTAEEAGWLLASVSSVQHLGGAKARGLGELNLAAVRVAWRREGQWVLDTPARLIKEAIHV